MTVLSDEGGWGGVGVGGRYVTDSSLELYGKGKKFAIRYFLQSELFAFTVFCHEKGFPCLSIMRGDVGVS